MKPFNKETAKPAIFNSKQRTYQTAQQIQRRGQMKLLNQETVGWKCIA
jgi:hypothetical protein